MPIDDPLKPRKKHTVKGDFISYVCVYFVYFCMFGFAYMGFVKGVDWASTELLGSPILKTLDGDIAWIPVAIYMFVAHFIMKKAAVMYVDEDLTLMESLGTAAKELWLYIRACCFVSPKGEDDQPKDGQHEDA